MINSPKNYSDWCEIFDQIENWNVGHTDKDVISAISNGQLNWISSVAERFTNRLMNLINKRIDNMEKLFNERLSLENDSFAISNLLILVRKELVFVKSLANVGVLPDDIKGKLSDIVINYAEEMQENLVQNAQKDLSGEMMRIVLGNKVDNI